MAAVMIAPSNVADVPDSGGHFWVYMQYVLGLRRLGCDVYWLEQFTDSGSTARDRFCFHSFLEKMERFGLSGKVILHKRDGDFPPVRAPSRLTLAGRAADSACASADVLLNFSYDIDPRLLSRFRKSVLMDIDPGLLQFWMSRGQLEIPEHDLYVSTGETVGTPGALFPDCGITWHSSRPIVSVRDWPVVYHPDARSLTTITGWWGDEWISDGGRTYENNKRVTFMEFAELASLTSQRLEISACFGEPGSAPSMDYPGDVVDRSALEALGWTVRHSSEISSTPEDYQRYIQGSRGEFSCAKPSCMKFQNAWISDRSLCYLASGKPVIVQHTGPSDLLPDTEGMFRFKTVDEAVTAIDLMNSDYEHHCLAARSLAETHFDAEKVLASLLDLVL